MSLHDAAYERCDHMDDAGPYLLRALPSDEHREYADHLTGCPSCRHEVEQLQVVVDTLPIAAPQLMPPPELKDRIMRVVDAEAELLRASGPEADRVPVREARPARRRWASGLFLRPVAAGALASVLLAVGVVTGVLVSDSGDSPTRNLTAKVTAAGSSATVALKDGHAALHVTNLPAAPYGRVYQVWIKHKGAAPVPTHTLFNVRKNDGAAVVPIEESVEGAEQILVTEEPDGGSRTPTGNQLITATLS